MNVFIVRHITHGNDILTAHSTLQHARASIKMRMRKRSGGKTLAGVIYEVNLDGLTPVEDHGSVVPQQIPGQDPLFQIP